MHMTLPLKQNYKYLILKAQILKKVNDLRLKKKKTHILETLYCEKKSFKTPDTLL